MFLTNNPEWAPEDAKEFEGFFVVPKPKNRLLFIGNFYNFTHFAGTVEQALLKVGNRFEAIRGRYVLFNFDHNRFTALRDPLGIQPLFYVRRNSFIALSDLRMRLDPFGKPRPLIPTRILKWGPGLVIRRKMNVFKRARVSELQLKDALEEAVRLRSFEGVGVLFSGGVDSSLLAKLSSDFQPILLTCGVRGSKDVERAKNVAKKLRLEHVVHEIRKEDVEAHLERAASLLKHLGPIHFELGLLSMICADVALKHGVKVCLMGQGSEELFAGYERHRRILEKKGWRALEKRLKKELENLWRFDLERNYLVSLATGLELRYPYLDIEVVRVALNISVKEKISEGGNKIVLRRIAKEVGVPEEAWRARKVAMQYGSGFHKLLKRIAKERVGKGSVSLLLESLSSNHSEYSKE